MDLSSKARVLIAVSLQSLKNHPVPMAIFPTPQQAVVIARSTCREYSFRFETRHLTGEETQLFRNLQRHGFTLVEYSDEHGCFYGDPIRWQDSIVMKAVRKVTAIYRHIEDDDPMSTYDPELADSVLAVAAKAFPKQLDMVDLKSALDPEPSDQALFTAIDALDADGFVEAKVLRSGPRNEIQNVAFIRATREGRTHVAGESQPSTPAAAQVFHGDQINVHGTVGAVGRNAQGVVNINERWDDIEQQVNLHVLAIQLEQLRTEYRKTALTRDDDRQVALLGDAAEAAEKRDGKGVAAILSKAGEGVLKMAKEIGTDVAVKVLVELATGK